MSPEASFYWGAGAMRQDFPKLDSYLSNMLRDFWMYCEAWGCDLLQRKMGFVDQRVIKRHSAKRNILVPVAPIGS
jgi:hypothetical protein